MAKPELNSAQLRNDLMNLVPAEKRREFRVVIRELVLGEGGVLDAQLEDLEVAHALLRFRKELLGADDDVVALARKYGIGMILSEEDGKIEILERNNSAIKIGAERARARRQAPRRASERFESFMNFGEGAWLGPTED